MKFYPPYSLEVNIFLDFCILSSASIVINHGELLFPSCLRLIRIDKFYVNLFMFHASIQIDTIEEPFPFANKKGSMKLVTIRGY